MDTQPILAVSRGQADVLRKVGDIMLTVEEALRATGGWKTTEVPRGTYADKSNVIGRKEAAAARAERRGETDVTPLTKGQA